MINPYTSHEHLYFAVLAGGALNIPFIQNIGQAFSLILEMMHIFLYKLDLHKSRFLWKLGFPKDDFNRHLFSLSISCKIY